MCGAQARQERPKNLPKKRLTLPSSTAVISEPALSSRTKGGAAGGVVPGGKARLEVLRKGRRQTACNILDQA